MSRRNQPDDADLIRLVGEGSRLGLKYALLAQYCGISESTLYKWRAIGREEDEGGRHIAFADAMDNNESKGAAFMLARIHEAANSGTWQAAAWILERRHGYTVVQRQELEIIERIEVGALEQTPMAELLVLADGDE